MSCDSISWPDISALRVLQLPLSAWTGYKLNTLLSHLSLEALTVTVHSTDWNFVYEDFVAVGDYITSTTSLKELCISFDTKGFGNNFVEEAIIRRLGQRGVETYCSIG